MNRTDEKRQMLWKGMTDRSWSELVQQWGVPVVESLQLQKSIAALVRGVWPQLGDTQEGVNRTGEGEQSAARGGGGHVGGCLNNQEAEGSWLAWREGPREMAGKEAAGVGSYKELTLSRGDIELEFGVW